MDRRKAWSSRPAAGWMPSTWSASIVAIINGTRSGSASSPDRFRLIGIESTIAANARLCFFQSR
jgi:hypothetical protein